MMPGLNYFGFIRHLIIDMTLVKNIQQDFSSGVDEVVIVTRDKEDLDRAVNKVAQEQSINQYLDRISFRSMDDYFN